jgi:hypothetical protein
MFNVGLRVLVRLCTELGMREAQDYTALLEKAERGMVGRNSEKRDVLSEKETLKQIDLKVESMKPKLAKEQPRKEELKFDEDVYSMLPE